MNPFRRAVYALVLSALIPAAAWAGQINERGEFVFDINSAEDMRAVGERAGIRPEERSPMDLGVLDCGRWASRFNVFPYQAVVAGRLAGRPGLVWICSGAADSLELSEGYCKQIGMSYVKHEGSVVTCRIRNAT
jgi:hypothetical protein